MISWSSLFIYVVRWWSQERRSSSWTPKLCFCIQITALLKCLSLQHHIIKVLKTHQMYELEHNIDLEFWCIVQPRGIYVWAGWVAKIRADVYHCPQLSERSAKLFDCFFGVSSTVITSTGAIGGGVSIASASNVLDQGGLIRQPFALYWHFGLVSFEHNYYHPLYAIAIVCFTITSVPCAPFMAVRHTAKNINSKNNNIKEK